VTTVTKAHLCFTFHIDEKEYQQDVVRIIKEKFGLEASIRPREGAHSAAIIINSANLARVFEKTFGKGAASKHIPDFMLFLPPEKQVHLLKGLWRGDGYINLERKAPRAGYATISMQLAGQIKTLLLREGIIPSVYAEPGSIMEEITHRESYRIHVGDVASLKKLCQILDIDCSLVGTEKEHSWMKDGYLFTPITSIETRPFVGQVHNFEVAGQHSYVTDAFTVHNCGDVMYIYISVKDDILTDVKFKTFGCGAAIATSSMVTDLARGKTLEEGLKITRKDVARTWAACRRKRCTARTWPPMGFTRPSTTISACRGGSLHCLQGPRSRTRRMPARSMRSRPYRYNQRSLRSKNPFLFLPLFCRTNGWLMRRALFQWTAG
jgi:hypothetical protein